MIRPRRSVVFRGVLPVGVLDATENRGRLLAALGVRVSHSPHGFREHYLTAWLTVLG
jgi:hypothetical protein